MIAWLLVSLLTLTYGVPLPPPLSSLQGSPQIPSTTIPRDLPVLSTSWGSVGSSNDVLGLSQVLFPPYLDQGVPTSSLTLSPEDGPCQPELIGPYLLQGVPESAALQAFTLVSSSPTTKLYTLTCTGSDCTSWHTANATSLAPFSTFNITYHELPGHAPFSDTGKFFSGCLSIGFVRSPGLWCAAASNSQCSATPGAIPLEGWQWSPTSVLRWGGPTQSETRLAWEESAVLQRLVLTCPPSLPLPALNISLTPAFRAYPGALGWTTPFPFSVEGYTCTPLVGLALGGVMACDSTHSQACALWVLTGTDTTFPVPPTWAPLTGCTAILQLPPIAPNSYPVGLGLALVIGANASDTMAKAQALVGTPAAWDATWEGAQEGWEARWQDAFTPKQQQPQQKSLGGGGHFSGNLPVLTMDPTPSGAALQRMYYMACYAILAHERTNLPRLFPRVYLTGTGNQYASTSIGGTMQFAWDQSFYSTLFALLDPEAAAADLSAWIGQPISSHFGIELDNMRAGGYFYAFNALSLYRAFSTYLRVTGDTSSPFFTAAQAYMVDLRDFWKAYAKPSAPTLADYSGDPNNYLECLSTYRHVTAGLQGGNAYMALDFADLLDAMGQGGAGALRDLARSIAQDTLAAAYVSNTTSGSVGNNGSSVGDWGGWWRCVDVQGGGADTAEVRHVVDFAYSAMGFANPRWGTSAGGGGGGGGVGAFLNASVSAQMVDFVQRQLVSKGGAWMRALSPLDKASPVSRPDHGTTGAYDAWPALTADGLAFLEGGFTAATPFLVGVAGAAGEGPYGQAHGVWPAVGEEPEAVFKTSDGWTRYLANNGAAFAETVLVTLFGYSPPYNNSSNSSRSSSKGTSLLPPTPLLPGADRGVRGTLACIRGPGTAGLFTTATLTPQGVEYSPWSPTCS